MLTINYFDKLNNAVYFIFTSMLALIMLYYMDKAAFILV